jgi:hypothetical protein
MAGAAVLVLPDREQDRRVALACLVPSTELMSTAKMLRSRLASVAHSLADALRE